MATQEGAAQTRQGLVAGPIPSAGPTSPPHLGLFPWLPTPTGNMCENSESRGPLSGSEDQCPHPRSGSGLVPRPYGVSSPHTDLRTSGRGALTSLRGKALKSRPFRPRGRPRPCASRAAWPSWGGAPLPPPARNSRSTRRGMSLPSASSPVPPVSIPPPSCTLKPDLKPPGVHCSCGGQGVGRGGARGPGGRGALGRKPGEAAGGRLRPDRGGLWGSAAPDTPPRGLEPPVLRLPGRPRPERGLRLVITRSRTRRSPQRSSGLGSSATSGKSTRRARPCREHRLVPHLPAQATAPFTNTSSTGPHAKNLIRREQTTATKGNQEAREVGRRGAETADSTRNRAQTAAGSTSSIPGLRGRGRGLTPARAVSRRHPLRDVSALEVYRMST